MAIYAKFLELKKILSYFEKPEPTLQICSVSGRRPSPEEMLSDLKKYCDPSQSEVIDKMLQILQMSKFIEKYKELEKSPELNRMLNILNGMSSSNNSAQASGFSQEPAGNFSSHNEKMPGESDIANLMQQIKQPGGIDQLKNMLSPQQRQMYETLLAMNQQNQN